MSRLSSSLSIAPFPPSDLRKTVPPAEWEACQEAWIAVADFLLSLSDEAFAFGGYARKSSPLVPFLVSYFRETSRAAAQDASLEGIGAVELRGKSYLLAHRALSEDGTISPDLLRWTFLADVSRVFPRSKSLPRLLTGLWARKGSELEVGFTKLKDSLIKDLDSKNFEASESAVVKLIPLLRTSPDVAAYVMTGSDLLDSLSAAYQTATSDQRESFVVFAFLGLVALTKTEKAQWPLLFDHLYALKSGAEAGRGQAQEHILPDLVSNTPILSVINVGKVPDSDKVRAENLVGTLSSFRGAQRMRPQKPRSRKPAKGKGRAQDDRDDVDEVDGMHAREMSLVSQIQDLFPNLGTGFVLKLLDAYDDDVERITAHLLDDSLPPELASSDRTQKRQRHHQHYIPSTSSPPPRQTHPRAPPKTPPNSPPKHPRHPLHPTQLPPPRPSNDSPHRNRRRPPSRPLHRPVQSRHPLRPSRLRPGLGRARRHVRRRRGGRRRSVPDSSGARVRIF